MEDTASIEVSVEADKSLTVITVKGKLQAGQLKKTLTECRKKNPGKYCLIDLSHGSWFHLPTEHFRKVLQGMDRLAGEDGKSALVFGNDADFGIGRMIESVLALNEYGKQVECFRCRDKAYQWITQDS